MKRLGTLVLAALSIPAAAVFAKPPQIKGFERLDQLRYAYAQQIGELKKAEAFRNLPREAKMVALFKRGVDKYESHTLDGFYLVDQILIKWTDFNTAKPTDGAVRTAGLLPKALASRYSKNGADRDDRWRVGRLLAQHLADRYIQVRKAAFDCLKAIYGIGLQYKPDAPSSNLMRWRHDWLKYVESTRKR